jgi:acetyl-CoA synthetase
LPDNIFAVPPAFARSAHSDEAKYREMYKRSVDDSEGFWAEQAKRLDWVVFPTLIKDVDFEEDARIRWFDDGVS